MSVFGAYYSNPGHRGLELEAVEEEKTEGGRYQRGGSGGGGAAVGPGKVLSLHMSRGCIGDHETVFLFGLLGRRHDTVTASRGNLKKRLNTAPIPASLHAGGVLVYGALGRDGANIIARAPNGAVDEAQSLAEGRREPRARGGRRGRCFPQAGAAVGRAFRAELRRMEREGDEGMAASV